MIWFTSDTHFGHRNILKYEPARARFADVQHHDEHLIERWNAVVSPTDRVYHLGDVSFNRHEVDGILSQLNGSKRLIMGNHDYGMMHIMAPHFRKISGDRFITVAGRRVLLSHIPAHPSQLADRAEFNIHGHVHSASLDDDRYINVSPEVRNLRPVSEEELF